MADRYEAAFEAAAALRRRGELAEAEAAYEELSHTLARDVGEDSQSYLLARYFVGLTRQDRGDDASAIEPLREAVSGFEKHRDVDRQVGLIGSALGLSLMRQQRFAEGVAVFERSGDRLEKLPQQGESLAAILHNLAICRLRSNDIAGALQTAKKALAVRVRVSGALHPLTVETQLVEALARVESGDSTSAAALIRDAAQVVLAGPGEAHPFFADALLVEARRVAREGDGPAAEALARRALFILDSAEVPADATVIRKQDARAIAPLWRTGPPAQAPSDVTIWLVSLEHTLRRYQRVSLDFVGSGDRPKDWIYFAPRSWPLAYARYATRLVFADCNAALNEREPSDPNFLDATSCEARVPSVQDLLAIRLDERFRARVWEPSIAFSVAGGARSVALSPTELAQALAAFLAMHRITDGVEAWLAPLGAELSASRAAPVATLQRLLF